jgi:hypothetical protein
MSFQDAGCFQGLHAPEERVTLPALIYIAFKTEIPRRNPQTSLRSPPTETATTMHSSVRGSSWIQPARLVNDEWRQRPHLALVVSTCDLALGSAACRIRIVAAPRALEETAFSHPGSTQPSSGPSTFEFDSLMLCCLQYARHGKNRGEVAVSLTLVIVDHDDDG